MEIDRQTIADAKAKLGDRNADLIASLTGMEHYDSNRRVGSCPNPDHNDSTPSCSYNPRTHMFHCFGCGYNVDIIDAYMNANNATFLEACQALFDEAGVRYDFGAKGAKALSGYYYPAPVYAEDKEKVYEYWGRRKISPETIDYLGIQQDERGNTLFQYWDQNDVLVSCKVRPSRRVEKGENKIWFLKDENGKPYDHSDVLFNINKINTEQPLIITSGEGDCCTAVECGFRNAVSIPGGDNNLKWIETCWDFLQSFDEIILIADNDESGQKFQKAVTRQIGEAFIKTVVLPNYPDPKTGELKKLKDLNEVLYALGKDAVKECIQNAVDAKIESVVDYSDVCQFDMSEVEGFTTDIQDLDRALKKFYMGTTNILTGVTGSGKSTMLSTFICKSVEQGFPVFVYSGELTNPSLKNWVDSVHAGQRNIRRYESKNGPYYKVNPMAYRAINEFYKGQIYFYKDGFDQTASNILATMEALVRKHGVRTFIIDNMSSIDLQCDDKNKYFKQDEFIRSVINFSKRFQVCCWVVIHPKKMDMVRRMNLFDLQGVVGAVNLAHRVLALYRVSQKEKEGTQNRAGKYIDPPNPWDVEVEILKDRFESGGGRKIGLWYDQPSRRFFDSYENLNHQYAWDTTDYGNDPLPYMPEQLLEREEVYGSYGEDLSELPSA